MRIEQWLRLIAGLFVLISLSLGYFSSPYWFLFTAFVGVNLFQSGYTNWCPMKSFLRWCGIKSCEEEIEKFRHLQVETD